MDRRHQTDLDTVTQGTRKPSTLMIQLVGVRQSCYGWETLDRLLGSLERCAAACARLDAHREISPLQAKKTSRRSRPENYRRFDARLERLIRRVDREVDRITAERLRAELAQLMRQAAA